MLKTEDGSVLATVRAKVKMLLMAAGSSGDSGLGIPVMPRQSEPAGCLCSTQARVALGPHGTRQFPPIMACASLLTVVRIQE